MVSIPRAHTTCVKLMSREATGWPEHLNVTYLKLSTNLQIVSPHTRVGRLEPSFDCSKLQILCCVG